MDQISTAFVETHRGYVAMWELDENDHWNGRYYTRAFQQAAEALCCMATGATPGAAATVTRHVRFLRELRGSEPLAIRSARLASPCGSYNVLHLMAHGSTGVLSAAALDEMRCDLSGLPVVDLDASAFGPRALGPVAEPQTATGQLLAAGSAIVSHLGIVRPHELDHAGQLMASAIHGRMNEGIPHVWAHMRAEASDLAPQGLGKAMVELRISRHGAATGGDVLHLVSWLAGIDDKRLFMRHQLENVVTGAVVAGMASATLFFDLQSRRATQFPPPLRETFETFVCPA